MTLAATSVNLDKVLEAREIAFAALALALAAALAFLLTPLAKRIALKLKIIDVPKDGRRMHKDSVPMFGGFAIALAALAAALLFVVPDLTLAAGFAGAAVIAVLGAFDDKYDLPAWIKLLVQIAAALIPVAAGLKIEFVTLAQSKFMLSWFSVPLTVLWIVGITNAVNFIDGLDGLAAGVSLISSLSLCLLAVFLGRYESAVITAALAGACGGFLPYNRHPAKIFMGDMGATFLGYMLAFVSVYGLFKTSAFISLAGPFIIMALPILDVAWAVIRRISKGKSPMQADRGHLHHYLVDRGLSVKAAVHVIYFLCLLCSIVAVVFAFFGALWALVAAVLSSCAFAVMLKIVKNGGGKSEPDA